MAEDADGTGGRQTSQYPRKLGRYEVIGVLGKGAMGVVLRGRDPKLGREVALKTLRTDPKRYVGEPSEMLQRFHREAKAAGRIAHPNIVTIYDLDEHEGVCYIAMELLEGIPLDRMIRERGRLPVGEALAIVVQICDALHYLHHRGIFHRDLKPANIMLLEGGHAKLMDFGIAKDVSVDITQPGSVLGTPNYMSPEQISGRPVDARSDLFTVGIVLYELVTGQKPFSAESITALMQKIVYVDPAEPGRLEPTIPSGLNALILKALQKDPAGRYQSAKELGEALRPLLDAELYGGRKSAPAGPGARPEPGRSGEASRGEAPAPSRVADADSAAVPPAARGPVPRKPSASTAAEAGTAGEGEGEGEEEDVTKPSTRDEGASIRMPQLSRERALEGGGRAQGGRPEVLTGTMTPRRRGLRPFDEAPIQPPAWAATQERKGPWIFAVLAGIVGLAAAVAAVLLLDWPGRVDVRGPAGRLTERSAATPAAPGPTPETPAAPPEEVIVVVRDEWVGGHLVVDGGTSVPIESSRVSVRLTPGTHKAELHKDGLDRAATAIVRVPPPHGRILDLSGIEPPGQGLP